MEPEEVDSNPPMLDWATQLFVCLPPAIPLPLKSTQVQQLSPAALAYIGDAVYELYIRTWYLLPPQQIRRYHNEVVAQVRAESQAEHLRSLAPHLTPAELEILRRGRNAVSKRTRRANPEVYQQATSLETLMGYLYLTDPQRLTQLLGQLRLELTTNDTL